MIFTVTEDDLATLESELPRLMDRMGTECNDPMVRKRWEIVRDIIRNIRWDYGPPLKCERIPADQDNP